MSELTIKQRNWVVPAPFFINIIGKAETILAHTYRVIQYRSEIFSLYEDLIVDDRDKKGLSN